MSIKVSPLGGTELAVPAQSGTGATMLPTFDNEVTNMTLITMGHIKMYFSYQTLIAFSIDATGLKIRKNEWNATTGRHMNLLDGGEAERLSGAEFKKQWELVQVALNAAV